MSVRLHVRGGRKVKHKGCRGRRGVTRTVYPKLKQSQLTIQPHGLTEISICSADAHNTHTQTAQMQCPVGGVQIQKLHYFPLFLFLVNSFPGSFPVGRKNDEGQTTHTGLPVNYIIVFKCIRSPNSRIKNKQNMVYIHTIRL